MTDRLRLHPLTRETLRELLEDRRVLGERLHLAIPLSLVSKAVIPAIRIKLEMMAKLPPCFHPWLTYWLIVLGAEQVAVGLVGFKGAPNENSEVDIGYGIVPTHHGRGLATEAVSALLEWAFSHDACQAVVAKNVRSDNAASHRVLEKLGAEVVEALQETMSYRITRNAYRQEVVKRFGRDVKAA